MCILSMYFTKRAKPKLCSQQKCVTAGRFEMSQKSSNGCDEHHTVSLSCNAEEADTRMLLHVLPLVGTAN